MKELPTTEFTFLTPGVSITIRSIVAMAAEVRC